MAIKMSKLVFMDGVRMWSVSERNGSVTLSHPIAGIIKFERVTDTLDGFKDEILEQLTKGGFIK